jgi:hypothetical protein
MENQKLPNATAVLVLGILSILTCICYGGGLIFGVIALFLAASDRKLYRINPESYSNYQNLNIGRVLSIIGLILSVIMIVLMVWVISIIGTDALGDENLARERMQDYFGQ